MISSVTSSHDGSVDGAGDKSSARLLSAESHTQQQKTAIERSRLYVTSLFEDDLQAACFDEKLTIFSNSNIVVGQLTISISTVLSDGEKQILVRAASTGCVDAVPCSTTVEAYLTMNGQTVLQHHHEHVHLAENYIERDTYIKLEDDHYDVQSAIQQQQQGVTEKSFKFSLDEMKSVVPEGLNLLLLRLLAMKGLPPDDLELLTLDAKAQLCPIRYRAVKSEVIVVDGHEMESVGIERCMFHEDKNPVTWLAYFASDGRLLRRTQVGSAITMRLCDLETASPADDDDEEETPRTVIPQKPLDWENDVQLHSKFLDRKAELEASHQQYLRKNPEVHALVADFLQHLLLHKPRDVLQASVDYFATFKSHNTQAPPSGQTDSNRLSPANG